MKNKKLQHEVDMAKAWGAPDNESVGYSAQEFIKLIRWLEAYINTVEYELEILNSPPRRSARIDNI